MKKIDSLNIFRPKSPGTKMLSGNNNSFIRYWNPLKKLDGEAPSVHISERSGNTLLANTGNNADILLPIYQNGTRNGLAILDGTGLFDIGSTRNMSVAWRVRSENKVNPTVWYKLFGKTAFFVAGCYGWGVNSDGNFYFAYRTSTSGNQTITTNISAMDMEWHMPAMTVNVTTKIIKLYIDKVQYGDAINYIGVFPNLNQQFKIASTPNANEYLAPFDFSDGYFYASELSADQIANLYDGVYVQGALAHWGSLIIDSYDKILDLSGNGYHLASAQDSSAACKGYDKMGFRQGLDKGYVKYSNGNSHLRYIPLADDLSEIDYTPVGYYRVKKYSGNLTRHNMFDSYLDMNNTVFDRSDATRWANTARAGFYLSGNPDAWYIREINRFNLYYWSNEGYRGICFVKGYPNSFNPCQYLDVIMAYATNKADQYCKTLYKGSGDYEAELLEDTDFTSDESISIWRHGWLGFTYSVGEARYTGGVGAGGGVGVLRQSLPGQFIVNRRYRLSYTIKDLEKVNAYIQLTTNGGYDFSPYNTGFKKKIAGVYNEEITCISVADYFWEMQAGIADGDDGYFTFTKMSFKIIE